MADDKNIGAVSGGENQSGNTKISNERQAAIEEASQLRRQGLPIEVIARRVGLPKSTAYRHLRAIKPPQMEEKEINIEESKINLIVSYMNKGMTVDHIKSWVGLREDELMELVEKAQKQPGYNPPEKLILNPHARHLL